MPAPANLAEDVARKPEPDRVNVTGRALALRAACLQGGALALALACELFPGAYDCGNVLACDLSNVNWRMPRWRAACTRPACATCR